MYKLSEKCKVCENKMCLEKKLESLSSSKVSVDYVAVFSGV